jgi:hypothetical protein
MTHYTDRLPREIEVGAVRDLEFSNEVVTTDGGYEVRNARWSAPLRRFDVALPATRRDNAAYLAVIELYEKTLGGIHTFEMVEWLNQTAGETIKVRFDGPLSITGIDYRTDKIENFKLVEVRE